MTIYIYNTVSDEKHLMKDITNKVGEHSGVVRGEIDIQFPTVTVNATLKEGNYAYIPDFGRYYWIREKTVIREGISSVSLESDPLMSFAAQILQLRAYVTRSSYNYNMDMADRKTPCVVYDRPQVIAPQGIGGIPEFNASDTSVYMQCIGGV